VAFVPPPWAAPTPPFRDRELVPQYNYQSAPDLPIKTTNFNGTAAEFAEALAEDCCADHAVEPNVRV
jgi:hypothetical protein